MIIVDLNEMNESLRAAPGDFVNACEEMYERRLNAVADLIHMDAERRPLVLLSGPSGSGKTTTARILERILDERGNETHILSMDNYYYRTPDMVMPLDERGDVDFESPALLDTALLQQQLAQIGRGEPVDAPSFDFEKQCRIEGAVPIRRKKGEILIVEGIHALNPAVIGPAFSMSQTLYVSARTRVQWAEGLMHPSKVRLLRRMLRDARTRGQSIRDTAARLWSVSRGEELYIMPNKPNAEINIDTLIPYEPGLYRETLLPLLAEAQDDPELAELYRFLQGFEPVDWSLVPQQSLTREFIGGWVRPGV